MSRTRTRLLTVGFVLAVIAAGIGWTFYVREKQRGDTLAARVAEMEPDAEMANRVKRARVEMKAIETAYKMYYSQNGLWPDGTQLLVPLLEAGEKGLIDPWGQQYTVQIEQRRGPDGQIVERPFVYCQPPGDRPRIQVPEISLSKK